MANKRKLAILDNSGEGIDNVFSLYKDFDGLHRVAEKRTHSFALACVQPGSRITLKEALAAAYIQGIRDAAIVL